MPKYEYCSVVFNFSQGYVKSNYMKADGNHSSVDLWNVTNASVEEQSDFQQRIIAQLGEDGWMLCGIPNAMIFYFMRQIEQSAPNSADTSSSKGDTFQLNRDDYQLQVGDQVFKLTSTESRLMAYFLDNPNRAIPPGILLENVWEYPPQTGDPDLVRMSIRNLNTKVQRIKGGDYKLIRVVHGVGYMFVN